MRNMGSPIRNRKLTATQRLQIVDRVREGYTHAHLAKIYGVSRPRIGQIANADEATVALWEKSANLPPLEDQTDPDN